MLNNLAVLVASPDPGIRRLLRRHFDGMGCASIVKATAQDTLEPTRRVPLDLVVASAAMPDMNAINFIKALRESVEAPLIILLREGIGLTTSQILDCGADDCIEEPFLLAEFSARARRLLRRSSMSYRSRTIIEGLGLLEVEPLDRSVRLRGVSIPLTRKEFALLAVLAGANGQVVPYEVILRKVWGSEQLDAIQNLRRVVSSLRRKIEPDPSQPDYLTSVRGSGYRLTAGIAAPEPASSLAEGSAGTVWPLARRQ
jgi:two-component system KDP operon response regulator KdpE